MKNIVIAFAAVTLLVSCNMIRNREADKITRQEQLLVQAAKNGKVDTAAVTELLASYEAFADKYPGDTSAANFLFSAAKFYEYMHKPLRSIAMYEKIYNNFPGNVRRPYALFLQGFVFENQVGNIDAAKIKYQQFLKEYPQSPMAKDVQTSLDNLGKTPEQMWAEMQAKQQTDSVAVVNK